MVRRWLLPYSAAQSRGLWPRSGCTLPMAKRSRRWRPRSKEKRGQKWPRCTRAFGHVFIWLNRWLYGCILSGRIRAILELIILSYSKGLQKPSMVRESPEPPGPGFCWLWASGTVELLVGIASALLGSAALGLAYSRPLWTRLASSIGAIMVTATLAEKLLGSDLVQPVQLMDLGFGGALGSAGLAAALLAVCLIGTRSLNARLPRWAPLATVIALAVASAALYRAALT